MRAGTLTAEVRRLALPAILHSLLQTLVFVVDRVMLGRHGDVSLAAMQLGSSIEWSIWSVFSAFEIGTIAQVGRYVGAGDRGGARRAAWLSLGLAAGTGVALAIVSPLLLRLLPAVASKASPEALAEARGYLAITVGASPVVFVATIAVATLQAGGDTKTPLLIGVFANIVHVGLNRLFVLGVPALGLPAMGAPGAGISTAVTFALEATLAVLALCQRGRPVSLRADASRETAVHGASSREARALARIATPAFAERVLYHLGFLAFTLLIARLGDAAMAANQSLISVESVCFLSADGFGIAAAALVAQKLGARDDGAARRVARIAARDAIVVLSLCGASALALRALFLPVFSRDPTVLRLGFETMPVLALAQPFMATGIVLAQSLRGAGRTREVLVVSFLGAVVVRLVATWTFTVPLDLGLRGVWMGSTVDWMVRSVLLVLLWLRYPPRVDPTEPDGAGGVGELGGGAGAAKVA